LGVRRFYWYSWDDHTWVSIQTTEKDNATLTPSGRAYGIMQDWLVGAKMTACDEDADHSWTCELVRNGSPQWIVWNRVVAKMFEPPSTWHIEYVTSLLQKRSAFKESSLMVGPVPKLFAAYQ
jgi:hypothetical protein